jgi:hypothetical protein
VTRGVSQCDTGVSQRDTGCAAVRHGGFRSVTRGVSQCDTGVSQRDTGGFAVRDGGMSRCDTGVLTCEAGVVRPGSLARNTRPYAFIFTDSVISNCATGSSPSFFGTRAVT